jgi:hypothetical protein
VKHLKRLLTGVFAVILTTVSSATAAGPFSQIGAFTSLNTGYVVQATDWNNAIGGIYTWINTSLCPLTTLLNVVTTKGDLYVYDGSTLQRLAAGTNGQFLTADSTQSVGLKYSSASNVTNLTTKGDILGYDTGLNRVPVGSNGQVLTSDSGASLGVSYQYICPIGSVAWWSPTSAGTTTIPKGWAICDGGTHNSIVTPNLIGVFPLGGRPSGSGATPNASGYGAFTSDTLQGTINTYLTVTGGSPPGAMDILASGTTAPYTQVFPASYVLVPIMFVGF